MNEDVLTIGDWKTNGEMIADVASLGFIPEQVLDLTYGEHGGFWTKWRPDALTTNDLYCAADHHEDFRATRWAPRSFATVVFDPPYKMAGTPKSGEMDTRFGTDVPRTRSEILTMLVGGIAEAVRLADQFVLVKCGDQVNGGKVRWMTHAAHDAARALEMRLVCQFILQGGRKQPEGRDQKHPRNEHSTLLVFGRR